MKLTRHLLGVSLAVAGGVAPAGAAQVHFFNTVVANSCEGDVWDLLLVPPHILLWGESHMPIPDNTVVTGVQDYVRTQNNLYTAQRDLDLHGTACFFDLCSSGLIWLVCNDIHQGEQKVEFRHVGAHRK